MAPPHPRARKAQYKARSIVVALQEEERTTKTGQHDDTVVMGMSNSDHAWVRDICEAIFQRGSPHRPVFDLALPEFERLMKEAGKRTGLQHLALTPHTLRHGAASVKRCPLGLPNFGREFCLLICYFSLPI